MTLSSDEDDRLDREYPLQKQTKRHVCALCCKRFNRPSSLRIHSNTHTGDVSGHSHPTPLSLLNDLAFRCPYPGCGRRFNVSSNMRRHYRKHNFPPTGTPPDSWED
ncbi:hypothetical protein BDP27DRAFT_1225398 [Rhodocollybia butyracea]|uniref:C2H2-type domain-containing protein n=1 Tax=Rhodocollybia butyracea TaxID=206335 RepID=A0A9P5U6G1_9AGAR|nr:hypothetical protein BDP27DRAFT_1225398 [Rhodocollybia butyracea]